MLCVLIIPAGAAVMVLVLAVAIALVFKCKRSKNKEVNIFGDSTNLNSDATRYEMSHQCLVMFIRLTRFFCFAII